MHKTSDAAYQNVKQILEEARKTVYSAVNFEEEQRGKAKADYGEYLIKVLAERGCQEILYGGVHRCMRVLITAE